MKLKVTKEFKGCTWFLGSVIAKNKKTVFFFTKDELRAVDVNERWLDRYEIIEGKNMLLLKKRR